MNRKSFYIVMACLVVAAFGFSLATQFRSQTIYEQTCPNGNCETIVKEYEYLPIEDDYSEDQKPTIDKDAAVVDSMTGIVGENAETDENTVYNRSIFVAGENVTAQQLDINGMIFAAGMKVRATGKQQSIAAAGETVVLDSVTHQEAYLAGRNVELTNSASVRDLFVAGEAVTIRGVVRGDIYAGAGKVIVENATILGDANFSASEVEFKGENMVHGTLRYDSTTKLIGLDEKKVGGIATRTTPNYNTDALFLIFSYAAKVCSMIACIAIFVVFLARISETQLKRFMDNKSAVKDTGIGLVALIVVPSLILLLMSFDFLALINVVLVLTFIIACIASIGVASARLGKFVDKKILKAKDSNIYQIAMLGAVTFSLVWIVPIIGSTIGLILLISGFGYIIGEMIHVLVKRKQAKVIKAKK
ncbi:hypothetical protein IIZ81_01425 [Candidatus Saccharibacteria bacterium]|nr:hypothetical protein [Candidatus Saccharibacteria bacterium]